jgi:hypothetical protein
MERKYDIRPVRVEDFNTLKEWWESYDHMVVPSVDLLPEEGKLGLVVEKEGRMMAAAWVYLTNSDIGYVDFLVSDPNYKGRDRFEIITELSQACSELAIQLGCRIIWCMTTYEGVLKRFKHLGFDILDKKYSIVYTHHKAYDEVVKKIESGEPDWLSLFE